MISPSGVVNLVLFVTWSSVTVDVIFLLKTDGVESWLSNSGDQPCNLPNFKHTWFKTMGQDLTIAISPVYQ